MKFIVCSKEWPNYVLKWEHIHIFEGNAAFAERIQGYIRADHGTDDTMIMQVIPLDKKICEC